MKNNPKTTALDELERLLSEAELSHTWGQIQVDLQDGQPVLIRQTKTKKLYGENNRERRGH
jgi:hypothetical protein